MQPGEAPPQPPACYAFLTPRFAISQSPNQQNHQKPPAFPLPPMQPGEAPPRPPAYYAYELRGVVVHSGTAFAGHYYSYIKVLPGRYCPVWCCDQFAVLGAQWYCSCWELILLHACTVEVNSINLVRCASRCDLGAQRGRLCTGLEAWHCFSAALH